MRRAWMHCSPCCAPMPRICAPARWTHCASWSPQSPPSCRPCCGTMTRISGSSAVNWRARCLPVWPRRISMPCCGMRQNRMSAPRRSMCCPKSVTAMPCRRWQSARRASTPRRSFRLPPGWRPSGSAPGFRPPVLDSLGLTEEEFAWLGEVLYRRTGMVFTEPRRHYVQRRVADRIAATRTSSFAAYAAHLRADLHQEIQQFINAFTVNETYFYREDHQLKCLTADLLPERLRGFRKDPGIRIWCAPCSTGEEPYSVAIWLLESWPLVDEHDIEIIGSDIDTAALEACRQGIFGKRALMRLAPELVERYFRPLSDQRWQIIDEIRDSV